MHLGRRTLFAVLLFAAVFSFLMTPLAVAHAVLMESIPALNGAVAGPEVSIKLRFNVRIDADRSRLTLIRPDGRSEILEISKQSPADILLAQAKTLDPGAYRLRWQVLASDGHITRGEVPFRVQRS